MEGILKDLLLSLSNDFELASSGGIRVELGSRAERMSTEMFYLDKTLSSFFTSNFLATITNIIINVVILLCVLLITKHIVKVYGLQRDGDLAEPPSKIIERLIFSVVVLFLSSYIYNSIATISTVIAQTVASAIPT